MQIHLNFVSPLWTGGADAKANRVQITGNQSNNPVRRDGNPSAGWNGGYFLGSELKTNSLKFVIITLYSYWRQL